MPRVAGGLVVMELAGEVGLEGKDRGEEGGDKPGGGGGKGGGGGPGTGLNITPVECLVLPPLFRTAKVQMFSPPPFCDKPACTHNTLL